MNLGRKAHDSESLLFCFIGNITGNGIIVEDNAPNIRFILDDRGQYDNAASNNLQNLYKILIQSSCQPIIIKESITAVFARITA